MKHYLIMDYINYFMSHVTYLNKRRGWIYELLTSLKVNSFELNYFGLYLSHYNFFENWHLRIKNWVLLGTLILELLEYWLVRKSKFWIYALINWGWRNWIFSKNRCFNCSRDIEPKIGSLIFRNGNMLGLGMTKVFSNPYTLNILHPKTY